MDYAPQGNDDVSQVVVAPLGTASSLVLVILVAEDTDRRDADR